MKHIFASTLVISVFLFGACSMDPIRLRRQSDANTGDDRAGKGAFGRPTPRPIDFVSGLPTPGPGPRPPTVYALPAASEVIVGVIKHGFLCFGRIYGYYADVDNNCQIYHVCVPHENLETGLEEMVQYSFFCGNQTIFDQETLTCTYPDDALPCSEAPLRYDQVNRKFGITDRPT